MQASCPQCSQRIVIDDARVPDRPFGVRCPKCQAAVRLPGRTPAAPAAPAPAEAAAAPSAARAQTGGDGASDAVRAARAQLRRDLGVGGDAGRQRQVLLAVPDGALAGSLTQPFTELGYTVEVLDTADEGGRQLEDGAFEAVITTRSAVVPGRTETLYQRVSRLPPDARRRIFLVVVGDEFKTGDGVQAFAALADFVVHPQDAAAFEGHVLAALGERMRLYQPLIEARRRLET